jgi:quercetin dioxygenase-like cupin family protein
MDHYNWAAIPEEKMNDLLTRQVIHAPHMTIARLWLGKGAIVPLHSHVNEQISMVRSGSMVFEIDGERIVLRAGDVLVIPPHVPHRVEALEDSTGTDLFTPPREDWIRGDDAYLRG